MLNNEKISTVVHAKDVNRNGGLSSLFQLLQFCPDISRADLPTLVSGPYLELQIGIRIKHFKWSRSGSVYESGSKVLMTKN